MKLLLYMLLKNLKIKGKEMFIPSQIIFSSTKNAINWL